MWIICSSFDSNGGRIANDIIQQIEISNIVRFFFYFNSGIFYQQSGDAKKPYLEQYSAVVEDSPVIKSWTAMKNNIPINIKLNPPNTYFKIFLIEFFLPVAVCMGKP